jgi:hypothetical protein
MHHATILILFPLLRILIILIMMTAISLHPSAVTSFQSTFAVASQTYVLHKS